MGSRAPAKKTRAKHACSECNSRRVRCNVTEKQPCSNCAAAGATCQVLPSRRGRYPRRTRRSPPALSPPAVPEAPAATATSHQPKRAIAPAPPRPRLTAASPTPLPLATPRAASVDAVSATGTLFFGESNFLTLVPGACSSESTPAVPPAEQHKPRLTFPIPGASSSLAPSDASAANGPPAPGISPSTLRYLRDEGALTVPELAACLPALQAYFSWFHPSFPIVDRADMSQRLLASSWASKVDLSPMLLNAMLFIGATYCDEPTIVAMGFRNRSEAKRLLYTRARLLFHADWEKDEMILIQALFLMSFWRGGPADVRDVRYWLGVVITLCESYGLHRSPRSSVMNKSTNMARIRRRIWWSVYVRERQVAAALGLPSRIRDEDCDIEPLSASDLESDACSSDKPLFGSCRLQHVTYAIKMVEIARLLGRIIDLHFSPGKPASTVADAEGLEKALEAWRQSLPENMKNTTDQGSECVWTCLLHLAYNHLRILIHRNSFLHKQQDGASNQVVMAAACRISRIAEDMSTYGTLRYGQMHLITSLFAALCIHAISIRRGTGVARRIAENRAQICLLCLKEIQTYWSINNNVLDLFLQYLDRSIAERLHAAQVEDAGDSAAAKQETQIAQPRASQEGAQSPSQPALLPSIEPVQQTRTENDLTSDQYFNLVSGNWEGDDALGDLGLFLQADDFSLGKDFGLFASR
ncbi:hypothetical protein CDD81_4576 [Ophiocordyceps australis]|uniref:Zn(2)-C6 fungal-type domain-containing protein n=1 Tax=Ophiocordyceps australis TaxID=1399860 RepID=A0A2C5YC97_9HYPO|nr:hypothetical protein CDD81_4576 [Ophiocordyceps australis]